MGPYEVHRTLFLSCLCSSRHCPAGFRKRSIRRPGSIGPIRRLDGVGNVGLQLCPRVG